MGDKTPRFSDKGDQFVYDKEVPYYSALPDWKLAVTKASLDSNAPHYAAEKAAIDQAEEIRHGLPDKLRKPTQVASRGNSI